MTVTKRPSEPGIHGENKMATPSALRGRRPASVLLTILVLAVAYWTGAIPSGSFDGPRPAPSAPAVADDTQTSPGESPAELSAESSAADRRASDPASQEELLYGLLRKVSANDYLSPAGLIYGSGSEQGHRLEHLRRHTVDDPGRNGPHGVFDGGMEGALKTIDLAYEQANTGQRTNRQVEDDRIIYTVDLGKRVGYVGGREGQRRRHPMARRVRMVLEGKRLVTAFPL